MTKRLLALVVAIAGVLGLTGVALANAPERASYGLEEAALSLAADPAPPAPAAAPTPEARKEQREKLRECAKAEVDGGAKRPAAVKECADQLGLKPGGAGRPGKDRGARGLRGAAHAELLVPKKGAEGQWETIVVDRGKVTAASAESISLQRPDGPTVTLKVVAATKVKGAATVADVAVGRPVVVVSAGGEARSVLARK